MLQSMFVQSIELYHYSNIDMQLITSSWILKVHKVVLLANLKTAVFLIQVTLR